MAEFKFSKSNHLDSMTYEPNTRNLVVKFKTGQSYTHRGVPQEAVTNFMKYRSPGEFYHSVIKRFPIVD